jgi:hypothetical protein
MKGGQVVAVPEESEVIPCPTGINPSFWDYLTQQYNNSQLMAVKYVRY